ncbi:hypothetical protein C8A01DRAFT_51397 [Parachaetomium inaequale]|uniref:Calcineurin-like phosphoesterase domain-containing protein n=1 Tax=Parachaetomium inaequale TaxID=2588326 RepID=A0AAN6P692_9PEZI|nr:hypothetical protein C8A01DRAFT_51397 [Parachaetomium inaequale]
MSPTVFQIVSNLHLETQGSYEYNFKQTAPNLALLGDIGQVAHDALFAFLEKQLTRYWNFAKRIERLQARSTIGRFIFLDQTRYDINTILTVLGCTLFSRVTQDQAAAVAGRLIDFRQILNWTVEDHVDAHLSDLRWLNTQVAQISQTQPQRQIVIFTHHSPTTDERATDIRHKGSPVASGFATNLGLEECWTNPSVVMWAFGHTHFSCNFVDERGKRVVANQRGYAMAPQSAFDSEKTFVVGKETGSSMLLV